MTQLASRSGSQILRTFLPQQTADLRGGIYRVVEWTGARPLPVDADIVRRRVLREIHPWESARSDAGFAADLRSHARLEVVELDDRQGVTVERFPQVWLCQNCKRIGKSRDQICRCGTKRWGQLHFLGFHACGAVTEPWIKRCPAHDDVRLVSPRSARAADIRFVCPVCNSETMRGLGFNRSCAGCGESPVTWNVHKARSVYTPRGCVLVNPPRPEKLRELLVTGGARRALAWVVEGMTAQRPEQMGGKPTRGAFIENLVNNGLPRTFAEKAASDAAEGGLLAADDGSDNIDALAGQRRTTAEQDALDIALALGDSRTQHTSLLDAPVEGTLADRYRHAYPAALERAGLHAIDLVERFPVLNVMFGYTRGGGDAGATRLVPFRNPRGGYRLHGDLSETEALLVRLDPLRVASWLTTRGHALVGWTPGDGDSTTARIAILASADLPPAGDKCDPPTVGSDLLLLVHSLAHRMIRQTAVLAGIDRDALSEYLVPTHLGFFIYASARGDFVLGGLQALFETVLDSLLDAVIDSEHRCPLDPGCTRGAGACSACLHIGEPSCRAFNTYLDRRALFGPNGFLRSS
jgi:hypothetical protein